MNQNAPVTLNAYRLRRWRILAIGLVAALLVALPGYAAEQIYINYGLLGVSVAVQDLDRFAQTGDARGTFGYYLSRLPDSRQEQLRQVLQARYNVDPVMVDRFSYTVAGERLLTEAGTLIKTAAGQNGLYAIRAAAILAAADPQGLSVLNFLHQFPTEMQVDVGRLLRLVRYGSALIQATARSIVSLEQQADALIAAKSAAIDFSQSPDLRAPGSFQTSSQTLSLYDRDRDRSLTFDLYLPEAAPPAPVIVVSNGLGARRDRFDQLAQHLASHGFAVAIPDHPGSDRQRLEAFYSGLYPENFDASEFIDRPIDITFLLDELAQRNQAELQGRLNVQQVGVFGYSFGGTTALSLAGASIDPDQLHSDCQAETTIVNISLLYQCRALELSQRLPSLRDNRVKAVYVFVPFGKSLFGPAGLSQVATPVLWEATDQDLLTPLVIEQLPAFGWLSGPDNYLAVSRGLPHAQLTLDILNRLTNRSLSWPQLRAITETYHRALSLAFFKTYLAQDDRYRPYLHASYADQLTEPPYRLSLVQSLAIPGQSGPSSPQQTSQLR